MNIVPGEETAGWILEEETALASEEGERIVSV